MMIPQQVSIVGFIKVCNLTHIYGSYLAMIIPAIAAPTTVYFMKQYMETGLSTEIVEAARIDGSGEIHTFNTIVLPLLKPAMATQAIFYHTCYREKEADNANVRSGVKGK